jgi:hypothetical protein
MKVVTPYRPGPAVSQSHRRLGAFDWIDAIRMLSASVTRACRCSTKAISDRPLDVPSIAFETRSVHLMPWILEVCLRYLESDAFDDDTVMISPDMLVFRDLSPWFTADLGLIVRLEQKYRRRPILNGVQWWRVSARDRLIAFYRRALGLALELPVDAQIWGGDTEPLVTLTAPLGDETVDRSGLSVRGVPCASVMQALSHQDEVALSQRRSVPWPSAAIIDFRYLRKRSMRAYFDATIGAAVMA